MFGAEGTVRIPVRVQPGAVRNEVVGFADGVLQVRIAAPPVKGKANRELVAFLSHVLRVSKSRVAILRGHTAKNKIVAVNDLSQEEIGRRLSGG
ncbi:MAG TPA: YggU family protein [Dehalococcoidia bacterium]|nr:YggU family protein [Dehalococcoidia bacterium]